MESRLFNLSPSSELMPAFSHAAFLSDLQASISNSSDQPGGKERWLELGLGQRKWLGLGQRKSWARARATRAKEVGVWVGQRKSGVRARATRAKKEWS